MSFGLIVIRWIDRIAYAGLLEYEGVVYAGSVSDAARCQVADCELVLHVCGGCVDRSDEYVFPGYWGRKSANEW
jgi:hypothetical protein